MDDAALATSGSSALDATNRHKAEIRKLISEYSRLGVQISAWQFTCMDTEIRTLAHKYDGNLILPDRYYGERAQLLTTQAELETLIHELRFFAPSYPRFEIKIGQIQKMETFKEKVEAMYELTQSYVGYAPDKPNTKVHIFTDWSSYGISGIRCYEDQAQPDKYHCQGMVAEV